MIAGDILRFPGSFFFFDTLNVGIILIVFIVINICRIPGFTLFLLSMRRHWMRFPNSFISIIIISLLELFLVTFFTIYLFKRRFVRHSLRSQESDLPEHIGSFYKQDYLFKLKFASLFSLAEWRVSFTLIYSRSNLILISNR